MAKKNNLFSLSNILYALAAIVGVVAICMMFVSSVNVSVEGVDSAATYTGAQVTFGYSANDIEYFAFSFMNLLTYILVFAGVILAVLKLCGIGSSSKILDIVMVALFAVGGVFFFLTANFAVFGEIYDSTNSVLNILNSSYVKTITTGAIVAGVLSLVSAVLVCVNFILGSKKK